MTEPTDPDLIALATPYALHAVPESELADIERQIAAAPVAVAQAFADEVRAVRETMAVVSAATAVEPPDQGLCVGNGYIVEAVNDVMNVFNASGTGYTGASGKSR